MVVHMAKTLTFAAKTIMLPPVAARENFAHPKLVKISHNIDERTSSVLVQEDIRQSLIFKQYASKYFSYVHKFKEQCLNNYQRSKFS